MNIWILVFAPYEGGVHHQLMFRSKEAAEKRRSSVMNAKEQIILIDDFGVELIIDAKRCAIVLTNCESSAAFNQALNAANRDAQRTYGLPLAAIDKGSTLQ